jgi:hypothetical protein
MFRCGCRDGIKLTEENKVLLEKLKNQVKPEQRQRFEQEIVPADNSTNSLRNLNASILRNKQLLAGIEEIEKDNFTQLPKDPITGKREVGILGNIRELASKLQGIDTNKPGVHANIWEPALGMRDLENKLGKNGNNTALYEARVKNVLEYNKDNIIKVKQFLEDLIKLQESMAKQMS